MLFNIHLISILIYMDYKLKYLKYKQKYIDLKNKINGGRSDEKKGHHLVHPASQNQPARKFTKASYDMLRSDEVRDKFPFYCPDDKPYLCSNDTPSFKLCKPKIVDCNTYTGENTYPIYDTKKKERADAYARGIPFAYDIYKYPSKDCSKLITNSTDLFEGVFNIPNKFKIMTYNCWWNWKVTGDPIKDKFYKDFFQIRM